MSCVADAIMYDVCCPVSSRTVVKLRNQRFVAHSYPCSSVTTVAVAQYEHLGTGPFWFYQPRPSLYRNKSGPTRNSSQFDPRHSIEINPDRPAMILKGGGFITCGFIKGSGRLSSVAVRYSGTQLVDNRETMLRWRR